MTRRAKRDKGTNFFLTGVGGGMEVWWNGAASMVNEIGQTVSFRSMTYFKPRLFVFLKRAADWYVLASLM